MITKEADVDISVDTNESAKISSVLRARSIGGLKKFCIFNKLPEGEIDIYIPMTKDMILNEYPKDVFRRMELALVNIQRLSSFSGDKVAFTMFDKPIMYPEVWDTNSSFFILKMLMELGFVEASLSIPTDIKITASGWSKLYEFQSAISTSNQVFIAMWFSPEMNPASNTIHEAISACGYEPKRIDVVEHNNKICDQIIAEIKQSKFLVSDFTGHRGGVYYEAGYAHGLGLPVIFTCRESDITNLHFDTRQFNHIVWTDEEDLKRKLINRIKATII
ncbi:hypothetical protein DWB64_15950 [Fusibacter sp. A1]|nr:hypothetical protein DWB64_15950 [Fusibacter sp. A1]